MKTQYYTASSLDGFIATEDHSLDWLFQFGDTGTSGFEDFLIGVGAIAMGSQTYEWILRNHVRPDSDAKQPWPYEQPSWVFTTRPLPTVPGADIRFVQGDVRHLYRKIAKSAGDKNIWIVGGGDQIYYKVFILMQFPFYFLANALSFYVLQVPSQQSVVLF